MKNNLVSIIIPNFNRENLVLETLKSVKNQSYFNWECIIVDDGSTDNSYELIKSFILSDNRFKLFKRPYFLKKGHCSCRNYGFEKSKGQYINWFDSDDIMHPDFILEKIKIFSKKEYDFVSCEIAEFKNNITINKPILNDYSGNVLKKYFQGKISFYCVCAMWRKDFLINNDLKFDNKLIVLEDWKFNIDALFISNNYFLLKKTLIYYRRHDSTISEELANYNPVLILQEFYCRKKMYNKYKNKNLLSKSIKLFYTKRLLFLLRALLLNKNNKAYKILIEILTINKFSFYFNAKILLGFISYKTINKGYRFLK